MQETNERAVAEVLNKILKTPITPRKPGMDEADPTGRQFRPRLNLLTLLARFESIQPEDEFPDIDSTLLQLKGVDL